MNYVIRLLGIVVFVTGAALSQADNFAYYITPTSGLGTVDLNTGSETVIGGGYGASAFASLAELGGVIYTYEPGVGGGQLISINTSTGAATTIGASEGTDELDVGATLTGLYGDDVNGNFYSINPTTGVQTFIGVLSGGYWNLPLSSGNASLFGALSGGGLVGVDPTTANESYYGTFDDSTAMVGGLMYENGQWFGSGATFAGNPMGTFSVNPTFVTDSQLWQGTYPHWIVPDTNPTPEPVTLAVLGAAGIVCRRRSKAIR